MGTAVASRNRRIARSEVDLDVAELVEAARAGDQRAWDQLVERFQGVVWGQMRLCGLSRDLQEDVFVLTWLRLFENLDSIREPERLAGWLATTARREMYKVSKAQRRLVSFDDSALPEADPSAIDEDLLSDEMVDAATLAFARLSQRDQDFLKLRVYTDEPLSLVAILEEHDIRPGSVGPTTGRIVAKLRRDPAIAALMR